MKTIGLKAAKQDETSFTKEEKIALQKQLICFKNTALIVEKDFLTEEAIENCTVPVVVDLEMAEVQTNVVCECESYNLYYGKKVSCYFRKKVMTISKELWPSSYKEMANGLMAVMHRETSGSLAANQLEGYKSLIPREKMTKYIFNKINPKTGEQSSRAVGLIQFTQSALEEMKEFTAGSGFDALHTLKLSYSQMTEVEQLDKVKKYMKSVKALPKIPEDIYVAVFAPYNVGDNMDTIMYEKGTNSYISNPGLDLDNNGIQIKELLGEFKKSLLGGIAYSKYKCENSGEGNKRNADDEWHHPVNNPQLRGWYSTWAPERSIHSSNIVGRSKGKHDGIDLYAPTGTVLYACIDGEVNEIYYSESYGNCINIKGDYNGKTYWFFYAHLSETFITAKDEKGNPTKIKAGKEIGKSGKTGSSATALKSNQVHLHFEIRTTSARTGGRVDPFDNISELNEDVVKEPKKENQP